MTRRPPSRPTPALAEMLEADEANGVAIFEPGPVVQIGPTPPPPEPSIYEIMAAEPPDWRQEWAQHEHGDSTPLVREVIDDRPPDEPASDTPETPRLDAIRQWRREQVRPA